MDTRPSLDVGLVLREISIATARLEAQQKLRDNSKQVYETATATGSHALARIAKLRLQRHEEVLTETESVLRELRGLLPQPQPQLDLTPTGARPASKSKAQ